VGYGSDGISEWHGAKEEEEEEVEEDDVSPCDDPLLPVTGGAPWIPIQLLSYGNPRRISVPGDAEVWKKR